jgi:hypothetical protein
VTVRSVAFEMGDGELEFQVEPTTAGKFRGRWFVRVQSFAPDPEAPEIIAPTTLIVGPLTKRQRQRIVEALGGKL